MRLPRETGQVKCTRFPGKWEKEVKQMNSLDKRKAFYRMRGNALHEGCWIPSA